jgi:hypothetical protein
MPAVCPAVAPPGATLGDKDEAWEGRCDAFARVSAQVAALISARAGAAVIAAGLVWVEISAPRVVGKSQPQ